MDMLAVQESILEETQKFFTKASVIWANQLNTRPQLPYVTLRIGDVSRNAHYSADEDGFRSYYGSTVLDVNLYTEGKPMSDSRNAVINYANTASSDLMDFCDFLESETITDELNAKGIAVSFRPPIKDLTELEKERKYQYRAQAEFDLYFMIDAGGAYGMDLKPEEDDSGDGVDPETAKTKENYSGGDTASYTGELSNIETVDLEGGNYEE